MLLTGSLYVLEWTDATHLEQSTAGALSFFLEAPLPDLSSFLSLAIFLAVELWRELANFQRLSGQSSHLSHFLKLEQEEHDKQDEWLSQ